MRTQIEILVESIANLHIQLSASLARESELRDQNQILAERLNDLQSSNRKSSPDRKPDSFGIENERTVKPEESLSI